jgi:hypothetical protein
MIATAAKAAHGLTRGSTSTSTNIVELTHANAVNPSCPADEYAVERLIH